MTPLGTKLRPDPSAGETPSRSELFSLYERDETAWLELMSRLITEKQHDQLDYENLASYLNDMAIRDRREVNSRLIQLMLHVLKWIHQPAQRTKSWFNSIKEQRLELQDLLKSKVLEEHARINLAELYGKARAWAQEETGKASLPEEPLTLVQLLADGFPQDLAWASQRRRKK